MPAPLSDPASTSALNCGLARELGNARTSTSIDVPTWRSRATNSAAVRFEWPTVYTTVAAATGNRSRTPGSPPAASGIDPAPPRRCTRRVGAAEHTAHFRRIVPGRVQRGVVEDAPDLRTARLLGPEPLAQRREVFIGIGRVVHAR